MFTTKHEVFAGAVAPQGSTLAVPKTLLVFAHPDDETIAIGARLQRFYGAHLVHVTDGAPRNEQDSRANGFRDWKQYRDARQKEMEDVLRLAGLSHMDRTCLEIPDQQASLNLVHLTRGVADLIRQHRPEVVFTHPYEGGHPDHDACAFAVHHAVRAIKSDEKMPLIVEAAFYHASAHGIETGTFISPSGLTDEVEFALTLEEQKRKEELLACFTTQQGTLSYFSLTHERFRVAPRYDFLQPPHPGPVFYDSFSWGMTSLQFCALARDAHRTLQSEAVAA